MLHAARSPAFTAPRLKTLIGLLARFLPRMAQQLARPMPADAGRLRWHLDFYYFYVKTNTYARNGNAGVLDSRRLSTLAFPEIMKLSPEDVSPFNEE
ncbi:hypothetical protein [Bradyrhizobium sp. DASA03120]|uniref:hypothetical protein n=1 Tax=Bradyrhizobium sp. SMVTL-02 TaxID=3395917 RepID=UPI003F70C5A9